jgi:hypothetical protein
MITEQQINAALDAADFCRNDNTRKWMRAALTAALAVEQKPDGYLTAKSNEELWSELGRKITDDAAPVAAPSRDDVVRECISKIETTHMGFHPNEIKTINSCVAALRSLIEEGK